MRRTWWMAVLAWGLVLAASASGPVPAAQAAPAPVAAPAKAKAQELAERLARRHGIRVNVDARLRRAVAAVDDGERSADFEAALERLRGLESGVAERLTTSDLAPISLAVAIVESGLKDDETRPGAKQPAGYFQLMPRTARSYGLKVNAREDERLEPAAAQQAAETLLRDLHDRFGDWEAALAAYNEGEFRVAARNGKVTSPYVRRVLATALLLIDAGLV